MPAPVEVRLERLGYARPVAAKPVTPTKDSPDESWDKADIATWLEARDIEVDRRWSKDHMLELVE